MISRREGRIAINSSHANVQEFRIRPGFDQYVRAAFSTKQPLVFLGRRVCFYIGPTGYIAKFFPGNASERGVGSAMQSAALRTMAVAKVRDVAIDLITNTPTLAAPGDHFGSYFVILFHWIPIECPNETTSRAGRRSGSNSNVASLPGLDGIGPAFAQRAF